MIVPVPLRRVALALAASVCLVGSMDSVWAGGFHGRGPTMQGRGPGMAGAPHDNRGRFQAARVERLQGIRAAQRPQRAAPREPAAAAPQPAQPQPASAAPSPADPAQNARPGRLTPDERRTLRQQINEAGRDVYRPNRP